MSLTDNLVAYWKLDEASGTRNDSHSTNHLSDSSSTGSATGKISNAADFESGSNNFLTIADNAALSGADADRTWAAWVQLESKTTTMVALSKWNATGDQREYQIYYDQAADRFTIAVSSAGTSGTTTTAAANNFGSPSTGTWYWLVGYHDATNDLIGIQVNNGTANTASHANGVFNGTSAFNMARQTGGTSIDWDGLIDEAAAWSRLLTDAEKAALYNAGRGLAYSFKANALRHYYRRMVA